MLRLLLEGLRAQVRGSAGNAFCGWPQIAAAEMDEKCSDFRSLLGFLGSRTGRLKGSLRLVR